MQCAVAVSRELQAEFIVKVIQATGSQWPELIYVSLVVKVVFLGFVKWSKWELVKMCSAMTGFDCLVHSDLGVLYLCGE